MIGTMPAHLGKRQKRPVQLGQRWGQCNWDKDEADASRTGRPIIWPKFHFPNSIGKSLTMKNQHSSKHHNMPMWQSAIDSCHYHQFSRFISKKQNLRSNQTRWIWDQNSKSMKQNKELWKSERRGEAAKRIMESKAKKNTLVAVEETELVGKRIGLRRK